MGQVSGEEFAATVRRVLTEVTDTQGGNIGAAADLLAGAVAGGGVVHTFGSGHSRAIAHELTGRAGGLVPVNMLAVKDLVMWGDWSPEQVRDPKLERAYAGRIKPIES